MPEAPTRVVHANGAFFQGGQASMSGHQLDQDKNTELTVSSFRLALGRFLDSFSVDGGKTFFYREQLLSLRRGEMEDPEGGRLYHQGSHISGALLDLGHVRQYRNWTPVGDILSDAASSVASDDGIRGAEVSHAMAHCFISQPLRFLSIAEDVFKQVYRVLTGENLGLFQLELIDETLPRKKLRDLNASHMDKLVLVPGIVVGVGRVAMKSARIRAQCKNCFHVVTLNYPLWKDGQPLPAKCTGTPGQGQDACPYDPFIVIPECSEVVESQTAKFQELPEDVPTGDMPRTVSLTVAGVQVRLMQPGSRFVALGVYSNFSTDVGHSKPGNRPSKISKIYVLGLFDLCRLGGIARQLQSGRSDVSPQEIQAFRQLAQRGDILDVVTRSVAPSLYGSSDIKRSIACMLVGGTLKTKPNSTHVRSDIHILLLGDPSTAKSQFLKFASKLPERGIYTSGKGSSAAGLTAAIVKDPAGNFALEGGAMVLADGGIVCIDEFDKMRGDDRVAIHEVMEQQTISIAKAGITTVLKTHCGVLAAANPTFGSFDPTKDTAEQHDFETTILSRFDLIWLVRDIKDVERDTNIAKHIFKLYAASAAVIAGDADHQNDGQPRAITELPLDGRGKPYMEKAILARYLQFVKTQCAPRLGSQAAGRLENFYIEVRTKHRENKFRRSDQIPITVRQLESLVRLSEALAKIELKPNVQETHVNEAIRLFNEATINAASSTQVSEALPPAEVALCRKAEAAVLERMAIGSRASRQAIARDLQNFGHSHTHVFHAIQTLIRQGSFQERRNGWLQRLI